MKPSLSAPHGQLEVDVSWSRFTLGLERQ
jgi:hypothetical protein